VSEMSGTVDLAEFLSAYLVEMDDHLRAANASLMAADASLRKGQLDPRAVRDLFRALHTIKGLSAMVGVEPIVTIVHRMEGPVRAADRAGGKLPLQSVDVLLQGIAAIEQRTRALTDGKTAAPPPPALLAAFDGIEAERAHAPAEAKASPAMDPALAGKLTAAEREQIAAGVAAGRRAVRLDFSPSPALAERGIDINRVREQLAAKAEIVRVIPISSPPSPEAPTGLTFALLLLTGAGDAELAEAVGLSVTALRPLLETPADEITPSSSSGALAVLEPGSEAEGEALRRGVLRVDVGRVEEAMERLSTLMVIRFRLEHAIDAMSAIGVNTREITVIMGEHARQLRDLRAALLRVRMVPVAEVLERVPLLVRGLRRTTGKLIRLEIDTRGAELDKAVAERIFPALIHLVRNAVDHALEPPEERRRLGKPEEGLIRITCWARSNTQLELNVTDDGRGVDGDFVALRAGREAPRSGAALLDLLCAPGFSTRDTATSTSGRGMGLDIVRRIIMDELGGELQLSTRPGAGAVFTLRVPLTIAVVDVFAFACAGQRFVVPVTAVEEIVEIDPARVLRGPFHDAGRGGIEITLMDRRGEAVPVVRLAAALRLGSAEGDGRKAIVVRRGGEPFAFAVDRMLGQKEAVVRPLKDPLVQVRGVSGTTDLGDGRPTVVLDLLALAGGLTGGALARRPGRGEEWTA
jgi:two-component system, chemotaxis family, sensor kinase CheA